MRVLVIGSGGREHAMARRLSADPTVSSVVCTPGNPGMAGEFRAVPSTIDDPEGLLEVAVRERIDLAVVGPELPLSLGVADRFTAAGRLVFGPTAAAAQLESSKAFAKAFMARHGIPTARFRTCQSLADALDAVRSGEFGFPVVLKADGLAAGKGVVIATDLREAEAAARAAMAEGRFGAAGACLVVEECLEGPEVSFFAIADRERAVAIGTAQDHKRIFDHDLGPNTGGMGAFAPSPLITPALHASIMRTVIDPVVAGLASEGIPYCGFLYAGLMLTGDGPKVIEFNARLGDPEAQVLLPLLADPLAPLLHAAAQGTLRATSCEWLRETSVGVVLASRGYPESSESGHEITGIAEAERLAGVSVCQAGTALRDGRLVTAGGRVLTVVGRAVDYPTAIARAYEGVSRIAFDGMQFRRDIGRKALAPL